MSFEEKSKCKDWYMRILGIRNELILGHIGSFIVRQEPSGILLNNGLKEVFSLRGMDFVAA